ncbi:MAG: protein-L-isoaspartate(D-aspartate) O-methyltransferase [Planctomycetes bacterium]|nr:protein-L-isoaspartate(D-aspartate) O-methyltransferase [Planctomycetota bacterium]
MVSEQLVGRGITDERVLEAMRRVPRHRFVPPPLEERAYEDRPLTIGQEQTISQPYMVAYMTQALRLRGGEKVLEVGTGSGYQTALLCEMGARVFTIERIEELAAQARARLEELGYRDVALRVGDGTEGWIEAAPFDRIIVTASAPTLPVALTSQIAEGGLMLIPIGDQERQDLIELKREQGLIKRSRLCAVMFVKLVGREGWEMP